MGVEATMGMIVGSGSFAGVGILVALFLSFYVRGKTKDMTMKSDNAKMTFWLVLLAFFLMWTMWICSFMHQIYPLARPTVPTPIYQVKCFDDAMCLHVTKDVCLNKLYGYVYNDETSTCTPAPK